MMKNWHQKSLEQRNIGEVIADKVTDGMGSWKFVIIQSCIVIIWMLGNGYFLFFNFDKYPFILLNLAFSTQAAYASPLILMSQNRQEARDKVQAEHQYEHQESELKLQTDILKGQDKILAEIHKAVHKDDYER